MLNSPTSFKVLFSLYFLTTFKKSLNAFSTILLKSFSLNTLEKSIFLKSSVDKVIFSFGNKLLPSFTKKLMFSCFLFLITSDTVL